MTRRRWLVPAALVLAAALLVGGLYLRAAPRGHVPRPGPEASPEQTVLAYVEALRVHDFETSNAISRTLPGPGAAQHWWTRAPIQFPGLRITSTEPGGAGHAGQTWPQCVAVSTWSRHRLNGGDGTREEPWIFYMARRSSAEPWTIVDWGL